MVGFPRCVRSALSTTHECLRFCSLALLLFYRAQSTFDSLGTYARNPFRPQESRLQANTTLGHCRIGSGVTQLCHHETTALPVTCLSVSHRKDTGVCRLVLDLNNQAYHVVGITWTGVYIGKPCGSPTLPSTWLDSGLDDPQLVIQVWKQSLPIALHPRRR